MKSDIDEILSRLRINIKHYRKLKKLTQGQLATKLSVNAMTVSDYERGKVIPPLEKILKMCSILDVSITQLIEDIPKYNETMSMHHQQTVIGISLLGMHLNNVIQEEMNKINQEVIDGIPLDKVLRPAKNRVRKTREK